MNRTKQLNDLSALLSFKPTWQLKKFMRLPHRIISLFTGNQAFKTSAICFQYVMRVLGHHPVPKKNVVYFECKSRNQDNLAPHGYYEFIDNGVKVKGWEKGTWNIKTLPKDGKCPYCGEPIVIHQRTSNKIRLCAETLPGDKEQVSDDKTQTAETKNTIYPELKKWLPPFLLKRDITFRNPAMIVKDPLKGMTLNNTINKGNDIIFDFISYNQSIQSTAGIQRLSIFCDEESPKDFWDEQIPRLLKEDGDLLLGLTPANLMSWTYDEIFEKAQIYYRTSKVCEFLNKTEKDRNYKTLEITDSPNPIAVIQAATDDNPTLSPQVIDEMFFAVDDPDVLATRRYGIHKQVSGRIFKTFDYKIHFIDYEKYFPTGMFHDWNHYRMIDYHSHNKWACVWLSVSPYNEAFVWKEWSPDPERIITRLIVNEMAVMSGDYKFKLNLVDALAAENQPGSGTSTLEDLNDFFLELKREGICTGAYFETWNTKGIRGREVIRERLKYAKDCKRPFNNKVQHQGITRYLPTLWISNRCPETARSLKQWRLESRVRAASNVDKDRLERPTQKFSHYCTALEAIFKDRRLKAPLTVYKAPSKTPSYFQGARRVT
ncbi:hypothetical protein KAX02_02940 [candidate division WOR-3 bacterium]|nr:hypothetical protein [candidate division WOR-3 bacterium]